MAARLCIDGPMRVRRDAGERSMMLNTTEVRDSNESGAPAVSLAELLTLLSIHLGPLDWRILQLDAESAAWGDFDLDALSERIRSSPTGAVLEPEELFHLAGELAQVRDALLCVPARGASPCRPADDAFHRSCRVAIQCVEGARWSVTSDDASLHELLRETYQDVVQRS
jgi:hypothetical protein